MDEVKSCGTCGTGEMVDGNIRCKFFPAMMIRQKQPEQTPGEKWASVGMGKCPFPALLAKAYDIGGKERYAQGQRDMYANIKEILMRKCGWTEHSFSNTLDELEAGGE